MRLLSSETFIYAPIDTVWGVLVDFDAYPIWNPVEIKAKGEPRVGTVFEHTSKVGSRKPMSFRARIIEAEPRRALGWSGRIVLPGIFDVRHHFRIDPMGEAQSKVRLRQFEQVSGILVPFMGAVLRDTQAAIELANEAIKARAESIAADIDADPSRSASPAR